MEIFTDPFKLTRHSDKDLTVIAVNSLVEAVKDLDERIVRFETGAAYDRESMPDYQAAVQILKKALKDKDDIDSGRNIEGTREDCHNILFRAVKSALDILE